MRFDDRLSTVLRQPATSEAIARIQYRQLIDLLGTSPNDAQGPRIDAAYMRLAELSREIPAGERAAVLREPSQRLRSTRLVAQLSEGEPAIASAALAAACLSTDEWLDLIPALPIRSRGAVRRRADLGPRVESLLRRLGIFERGLPPADMPMAANEPEPDQAPEPDRAPEPSPETELPIEGIGAIVRRIEQFRKTRDAAVNDAPRLPFGDSAEENRPAYLETFDFATDAEGRIVWSDPPAAPMSIGLRITSSDPDSPVEASANLLAAFRRRQPVRGALLSIAGAPAIAGPWQADAAPRFERPGGRFVGYCGRMRRPVTETTEAGAASADSGGDRMRQVLHELRTPVNAIQGFAEIIQQQLFGPTPHEYRALAATIASDGARMLAGFEELERLVKLDGGVLDLIPGECDIAAVLAATVAQIEPYCARRGSGFAFEAPSEPIAVAMAGEEAERMAWRLLATLAGAAAPGELLKLKLRQPRGGMARIIIRLPEGLATRDDAGLFHATVPTNQQALSAGMFGTGFALRLAAAEVRAVGGTLERREAKLRISLPAIPAPVVPLLGEAANP